MDTVLLAAVVIVAPANWTVRVTDWVEIPLELNFSSSAGSGSDYA